MILALGYHRSLRSGGATVIEYCPQAVPMELAVGTVTTTASQPPPAADQRATAYGIGLDPLGFEVRGNGGEWRPFARALGGFRVFDRDVPNPRGTRFNFVADLGIGVRRRVGSSLWVSLALDLHHVSNAGLGEANPGINSIGVGLAFLRPRPAP